jgi:hypothetical protein
MIDKVLIPIEIGLTAAIVSFDGNEPLILTAPGGGSEKLAGLPFGPFDAVTHRTFESSCTHSATGDATPSAATPTRMSPPSAISR